MGTLSTRNLPHDALWWRQGRVGPDGERTMHDPPTPIRCRWDPTKRMVPGPDGTPISIEASVTTHGGVRPKVGDLFFRGTASEYADAVLETEPPPEIVELTTVLDVTEGLRGEDAVVDWGCTRFRGALPSIAAGQP